MNMLPTPSRLRRALKQAAPALAFALVALYAPRARAVDSATITALSVTAVAAGAVTT